MAGLEAVRSAALAGLVRRASDYADDATGPAGGPGIHRVLPVLPELSRVLPGRGLRRGSTIAVATGRARPAGSASLMLALLVEASRSGSWCAVVGVPTFGAVAAAQAGIALDRLALVPYPGPEWPTVVAALIDGVDVVVTAVPTAISGSIASRLVARARQRGCVLVPYGRWEGADITLQVMRGVWEGLEQGRGRLRCRYLSISARGRGAASRPKEIKILMPGPMGRLGGTGGSPATAPGRPHLSLIRGLADVDGGPGSRGRPGDGLSASGVPGGSGLPASGVGELGDACGRGA
jgi:hypothetical protein